MTTAPGPAGGGSAAARGVGTGLVLMAVFTLLWGSWTTQGLGPVGVVTAAVFAVVAVLFLVRGVPLLTGPGRRPEPVQPAVDPGEAQVRRRFGLVVGAETLAIVVASAGLGISGHDRYINPAIATVVGLHFLALAGIIPGQRTVNLATGTVLTGCALAAAVLLAVGVLGTDLAWSLVALVAACCTTAQGLTMLAARRRLLSAR